MENSIYKQTLFALALAAALSTAGPVTPALASGGSAGGGGKAGGAPSAPKDPNPVGTLVPLSNSGLAYAGKLPQGSVILGYAADGSAQSMTFSLSQINVPNGSVLPVRVIMGQISTIFTYYAISSVVYTEVDGSITVNHSSASLSLSTLNGDLLPNFPGPAGAGTTEIRILSPDGATTLLDGVTGSFHA